MHGRVVHQRSAAFLAAFFVAVPAVLAASIPASRATAPPTTGTCLLSGNATITPGLTATPQPVVIKATGRLSSCTHTDGTAAKPAGGSFIGSLRGSRSSCVGGTAHGTYDVTWSDGETSVSAVTVSAPKISSGGITVILNGKINAGLYVGEAFKGSITLTFKKGNCLFVPLTAGTIKGKATV